MLMLLVAGLISGVCLEFRYPLQLDDGVRLQGYMWKPRQENSIRALVFISHGYAELLTPYYREVAEAGAEAGLLMFGHDHLGHGRSDGKRGQAKDMSDYVEPLLGHCRYVQDQYPGLPLFIIGHSMGGLVAILSILQTQDLRMFSGAVLVSPLIESDSSISNPVNNLLANIFSKINPDLTSSQGIQVSRVTSDPYWQEVKRNDPLSYHGGYIAGHAQVINTEISKLRGRYKEFNTPFFMMVSNRDRLADPEASKTFFVTAKTEDKDFRYFNEGLHHFFIEKEETRRKSISLTVDWIKNRT